MSPPNSIDFLLIGAQKSGTTSLWKHLDAHPGIFVPASKEVEFFSDPRRFERGMDWYWDTYFASAPPGSCKGEATTQYMMFPEVPSRIRDSAPHAKLVAILRNPIDRAFSHYRMSTMRGQESRDFSDCVRELSARGSSSQPIDVNHDYLRVGEYGRILDVFLRSFPKSQFCLVFTEEFEADPHRSVQRVFEFLGVDPSVRPETLGQRFNVSGEQLAPGAAELLRRAVGRLRKVPGLRKVITEDRYEAFKFWSRTELSVRHAPPPPLDRDTRNLLAQHFSPDVALLKELFGCDVPWSDFSSV